MKKRSVLRREIDLFSGIEEKDLQQLLQCLKASTRDYRKGEFIFLDQDKVQKVGVVLSGSVHMLKEDIWGHKTFLAYMGEGDIFGETFAFRREALSYVSFYTASDAQILFLSLEHAFHPCREPCAFHTRLEENLMLLMGEKNLRLMEKIEVSSKATLREKILAYLSMQAQKQGQKYITVPLNRTDMANFIQANRSAMSRELSLMKAEGLIDYDGNTFVLKE